MKSEQEIRELFDDADRLVDRFSHLVDSGAIHGSWTAHTYPKSMRDIASVLAWVLDLEGEPPEGFETIPGFVRKFETQLSELAEKSLKAQQRGRRG